MELSWDTLVAILSSGILAAVFTFLVDRRRQQTEAEKVDVARDRFELETVEKLFEWRRTLASEQAGRIGELQERIIVLEATIEELARVLESERLNAIADRLRWEQRERELEAQVAELRDLLQNGLHYRED